MSAQRLETAARALWDEAQYAAMCDEGYTYERRDDGLREPLTEDEAVARFLTALRDAEER